MYGETLFYNGRIYTMDTANPQATAVLVHNGRIAAVGGDSALKMAASTTANVVNLGGRCMIPGLIDAHVHFRNFSLGLRMVDMSGAASVGEVLQRVEAAAQNAAPGEWIQGWGWAQDDWTDRRFPTAQQLDRATPNNPAFLRHKSGHAGWANTAALQMAGIDLATPNPDGGSIQHNENGKPTGVLFETAMELVAHVIPPFTEAYIVDSMREGQNYCHRAGLVGLHDFDGRDCFQALQSLHLGGELQMRMVKNIPAERMEYAVGVGLRSGFGDEWLRIGGVKIFADGALGPRTAHMIRPYEGEPHNRGIVVTDKEEMMRISHEAFHNQLSLTVHAIGDQAVHDVLDVYESLEKEPPAIRPLTPNRIEHVQVYHPTDRSRLANLGVVASVQPTHATSDIHMVDRYWGKRGEFAYAFRSLKETGALVVFGSDSPIEKIDPLPGIHAAVTRRRADGTPGEAGWYPDQRFSVAESVYAFTMAAAITSGQQQVSGSISPGKYADFTVLSADIFTIPPDQILETSIAATIVNGAFRYQTFD